MAIASHAAPGAQRALIDLAKDPAVPSLRADALVWIAGRAAEEEAVPSAAASRDPDEGIKRAALAGLQQMPKEERIPMLIDLATHHKSAEVRRDAMLWLGRTNDDRALEFFEQRLRRTGP